MTQVGEEPVFGTFRQSYVSIEPYNYEGTFYNHTVFGTYYEKVTGLWVDGNLKTYKKERKDGMVTELLDGPKEVGKEKEVIEKYSYPDSDKFGIVKKSNVYGKLLWIDGLYRWDMNGAIDMTSNGDDSKEFRMFYKKINCVVFLQREKFTVLDPEIKHEIQWGDGRVRF